MFPQVQNWKTIFSFVFLFYSIRWFIYAYFAIISTVVHYQIMALARNVNILLLMFNGMIFKKNSWVKFLPFYFCYSEFLFSHPFHSVDYSIARTIHYQIIKCKLYQESLNSFHCATIHPIHMKCFTRNTLETSYKSNFAVHVCYINNN